MSDEPRERHIRSRQACEPCREKKIKCPAERPACSSCVRSSRACTYLSRTPRPLSSTDRITKRTPPFHDRFRQLESTVQNLCALLQDPSPGQNDPPVPLQGSCDPASAGFEALPPGISSVLLSDAVEVYLELLHLQPLPLFPETDLLKRIGTASRHLVCSFLSLTFQIKSPTTRLPQLNDEAHRYMLSAEAETKRLAWDGEARVDIVQSLCLLALRDLLACKPQQAQMTIASASQLEACRSNLSESSDNPTENDLSLRCRWSVYILETMFNSRLYTSRAEVPGPPFPFSADVPPAPTSPSHGEADPAPDLYNPYSAKTDHGILAYHIRMLSNWGHISEWLHHIRLGKVETPWLPESAYARLVARIYDCDSQLPAKHLLMNVCFSKRSPPETLQAREYWIPWIMMELECHAFLSILNHPFIHLVAIRKCSVGAQSSLFLQHTIDAAIFHSGWVIHFLRICEVQQLELYHPFIGHLVAMVGTVFWLLQFVQDGKVSEKAVRDVAFCSRYIARLADTWPHIRRKKEIFDTLQQITETHREGHHGTRGFIMFPPELLWELLNTVVYHRDPRMAGTMAPQASLRITTHLTHPLTDEPSVEQSNDAIPSSNLGLAGVTEGPEEFFIDDLSQFLQYSHYGMDG